MNTVTRYYGALTKSENNAIACVLQPAPP
uniref:Uncharacterized protein n=1 Tax=Zea mays TaxID=4577 RepID=C4IZ56_MAIZE|nr:unknown [Zea mays]